MDSSQGSFINRSSIRWYCKILVAILLMTIAISIGVVVSENAYAVNGLTSGQNKQGCYYVTYNVGDKAAKTNAICFKDTKDANGNDIVYMSLSDGASDPIVLSDGRELYMELVGLNPEYFTVNEYGESEPGPGSSEMVTPNSNNGGAVPQSEGVPVVQIWARFDNGDWESVSSIDLKNFSDQQSRQKSFKIFAEQIKNKQFALAYSALEPAGVEIDDSGTEESSPGDRSDEEQPDDYGDADKRCYDESGALGWIICPIITGISGVGEWLWGEIETNFLQIPVGQFFKDSNGIESAWKIFRDMANVVFIILFLFVIFSQLTGIGIDNYGIKKIMPKLIVTAILINLSYVICVLAVDLSNILGTGLNALFTSLANQIPVKVEGVSDGQGLAVGGISLGGFALFGLIAGPLGLVSAGLWVLGMIITIVFSMLFLFLILIIRSAGIVILIAIAPIAIVCYMLPNTEKMFKRWLDLLKALLFVYPICGALVGAGKLAGNLLGSIDNNAMKLAGMIAEVLPFFLIPMLLRQSLAMAGNIGARLSSVGRNLGRRGSTAARGAITGSDRFKNWSEFQQGQRNVRRASRLQRRLEDRLANGGHLSAKQRADLRRAQDTVLAQSKTDQENEVRTHAGYGEAMRYKQEQSVAAETRAIERLNDPTTRDAEAQSIANEERLQRSKTRTALMMNETRGKGLDQLMMRWNAAFDSGNTDELDAITNVISQRYGPSGASKIASSLSGKHGIANNPRYQASMRALQQTMSDNSSFAGNMKAKSPDAFQMIGDAGMRFDEQTQTMVQEDMDYFTSHNQTATKAPDWATTSNATLKRSLASGGVIDDHMLDELLSSDDPTVKAFRSDAKNRRVLQAAKYARENGIDFANVANNDVELDRLSREYERDLSVKKANLSTPAIFTDNGHSYMRQANGEWLNENGESMGQDFSDYIEHNQQAQQQIQENAQREEGMQNLSDAQLQTILAGTETGAQAVAKRDAASRESTRRSSLSDEQRWVEEQARDKRQTAIRAIAGNNSLSIEQKREQISKLRAESQNVAVRRQIDYQTRERQQQVEAQRQASDAMRLHEEDALRRGKTNITIPSSIVSGGTVLTTIQGYAQPADFQTGGTWSRDANGDHIYTESGANGRKWNASTGRYVR